MESEDGRSWARNTGNTRTSKNEEDRNEGRKTEKEKANLSVTSANVGLNGSTSNSSTSRFSSSVQDLVDVVISSLVRLHRVASKIPPRCGGRWGRRRRRGINELELQRLEDLGGPRNETVGFDSEEKLLHFAVFFPESISIN